MDPYEGLTDSEANELLDVLDAAEVAQSEERWADALRGYQRFLLRVPDPYVELSAATCLVELGTFAEADALLTALITRGDDVVRSAASAMQATLWAEHPARVGVRVTPADARVTVQRDDDVAIALAAGVATLVPPGHYRVWANADGFEDYEGSITLDVAGEHETSIVLVPLPVAEPTVVAITEPALSEPILTQEVDRDGRAARIAVPVSLASLAVGSVVLSGVSSQRSTRLRGDFNNYPSRTPESEWSLRDWEEVGLQGRRSERVTRASAGIGAGFAVAAVVSALVLRPPRSDASARVTLEGGASRAGMRIDW